MDDKSYNDLTYGIDKKTQIFYSWDLICNNI
jgi:hypothetical protein